MEGIHKGTNKEGKPAEDQLDQGPYIEGQEGPQIMKSVVDKALTKLKSKKAERIDEISVDFVKHLGE